MKSLSDAARGIGVCIVAERNMRIHVVACVYLLFFASRMTFTRGELCCLFLAIAMVLGAEMMNTSIERICDFTQPHINRYIRVIKDVAAGAVLACAVFAALVGAVLFIRPEFGAALREIFENPLSLVLLLVSVVVAVIFIFIGPKRLKEGAIRFFSSFKS